MVKTAFVPSRGDIVWLNFNPQLGHEQEGRRPAIILSPFEYNKKTGLAIACPITSQIKNYPFEVKLPENISVNGVIISDQVKNIAWKERKAEFICKATESVLKETVNKLRLLIEK